MKTVVLGNFSLHKKGLFTLSRKADGSQDIKRIRLQHWDSPRRPRVPVCLPQRSSLVNDPAVTNANTTTLMTPFPCPTRRLLIPSRYIFIQHVLGHMTYRSNASISADYLHFPGFILHLVMRWVHPMMARHFLRRLSIK